VARLMRGEGIRAKVVTHRAIHCPWPPTPSHGQFTMARPVRAWHAPHRHLAGQGLCRELFRNTHASSCGLTRSSRNRGEGQCSTDGKGG